MVIFQVLIDVTYPLTLRSKNLLSGWAINYSPFIEKLIDSSNFSGDWWDTKSVCSPVILVSTDGDPHDLLRCACKSSLRELAMAHNILKYRENAWPTFLDVIHCNSFERVYKSISIWVSIYHKVYLIFELGKKIREHYALWFWESLRSSIVQETRVICLSEVASPVIIILVSSCFSLAKIYWELAIKVYTSIFLMLAGILGIHVFSFRYYLMRLNQIFFNKVYSINIEYWHKHKFIFLKKFLSFLIFIDFSKF